MVACGLQLDLLMSTWSTRFGAVSYLGRKPILEWVAITAAIAITRVIFRSRYLYDIDSVNYALAVARFDPSVHQPHPPGYFLYVWFARIANLWMQNPNDALVAISVTTSCLAVVAILLLAENWFGATAARFAGLAFLFSPLGWFHGTVALSYIVEACFSAWIGYFCWRAYRGSDNLICVAALLLGLATGVRQSSILFLGPLFLICLMKCRRKMQIAGAAVLLLTLVGWLVPMTLAAGGISAYLSALWALWKIAPAQATLFNSSPLMSFARLLTVLFIGVLSLGALLIPAGIGLRNPRGSRDVQLARLQARFTWLWALPAFLFFTLIFLRFVNSGYMLILLPVACIWLGDALARCYQAQSTNKASLLLGLCAAANVLVFLAAAHSPSRSDALLLDWAW